MKQGSSLEKDVQRVYSFLLNMRDEGVVVGNPVFMTGKSGVQHEVDVYYEFAKAGIRHRVAIECKDWATPVSKGQIQEFESKLRDIGNITVALPDEGYVGEQFWIIMEIQNGKVTGSHYGMKDQKSGKDLIPLTFSRSHAERLFRDARLDPKQWAIHGLPRFALRAFLITLELYEKKMNSGAIICFLPPGARPGAEFVGIQASREDLIRDYYGEPIPSIEDAVNR